MFNKKKKRIMELEGQLQVLRKENCALCLDVDNLQNLLEKIREKNVELTKVNKGFTQTIEKQAVEIDKANKKIKELEDCFKPQVTMCEEIPSKPEKVAKKATKTAKTEPKKTSKKVKKA